jgi:hypothetical protein
MRKELFESDFNDKEENPEKTVLQCKVLQLLMNKDITIFNFPPGLNSDLQDSATELWQSILRERPLDLHTIICKCKEYKRWDVRLFLHSLLPLFPNLQVLRLENFSCNNQDLIRIASHLSKLRSVLICSKSLIFQVSLLVVISVR